MLLRRVASPPAAPPNYALYLVCGGAPLLFSWAGYCGHSARSSDGGGGALPPGVERVEPPLAGFDVRALMCAPTRT